MLYSLIAARDGELLTDVAVHDTMAKAEDWAGKRIGNAFGIAPLQATDFVDMCSETDGVSLTAVQGDGLQLAAAELINSFKALKRYIRGRSDIRENPEYLALATAVERLSAELEISSNMSRLQR